MIALCPFSGQKLLSSVLQLQWWLMNWSYKPLSHPFIQDLFQTVGDTDLLWIWMIQGGIYQPSDTYTSTCVEWYKTSQSAIAVGESSLVKAAIAHAFLWSLTSIHPRVGCRAGWYMGTLHSGGSHAEKFPSCYNMKQQTELLSSVRVMRACLPMCQVSVFHFGKKVQRG